MAGDWRWLPVFGFAVAAIAQSFPPGQTVDNVTCGADSAQTYALYLPSGYNPSREWPVLFAFDPGARGLRAVECYRAAAEKAGYIVAASNVSRNGSWAASMAAAQAMAADVSSRFAIDHRRAYTAGMSGGARVALGVALGSPQLIAGVIASAAAWPDSGMRKRVPFAVFGTAGTEDFNYREMRELDRTLESAHRVVIFEGGHGWPPPDVAEAALDWLDLQAMKSGRMTRDEARLDEMLGRRKREAAALDNAGLHYQAEMSIASDFQDLRTVPAPKKDKAARGAMRAAMEEEKQETQLVNDILTLEEQLNMKRLDEAWKRMAAAAGAAADTPERRIARRALTGLASGASERVKDQAYLQLVRGYAFRRPGASR